MPGLLEYFDLYTMKLGWETIPVYPNSKLPVGEDWNVRNYDLSAIRGGLELAPNYNIGMRLGGVVDVEGDNPEANRVLQQMTGGVPHPMYCSSRSIHHLFLSPDPKLTKVEILGIEFRGERHQSLLPPSVVDGVRYRWLSFEFPIPEMPPALKRFYWRHVQRKRKDNGMASPRCHTCERQRPINAKRLRLEKAAFASLKMPWQCPKCRKDNVRPLCRQLRKGKSC